MNAKKVKELETRPKGLEELMGKKNPAVFDRFVFLVELCQEMYMSIGDARSRMQQMGMQMNTFNEFLKEKELQDTFNDWVKKKNEKAMEDQKKQREESEKKLAEQQKKIEELEKDGN